MSRSLALAPNLDPNQVSTALFSLANAFFGLSPSGFKAKLPR